MPSRTLSAPPRFRASAITRAGDRRSCLAWSLLRCRAGRSSRPAAAPPAVAVVPPRGLPGQERLSTYADPRKLV
jgi:hypothetical protein